jgi:multicomponent Na+:H+ antiporter subunit D
MDNTLVLFPFIVPITGAAVAILLSRHQKLQSGWAFGTMLVAFFSSVILLLRVWGQNSPIVYAPGGWNPPFGIVFVADLFSAFLVVMSQLVFFFGFLYALGAKDKCVKYPAFFPLFLTLAAGLTGALLTGDLFNMFVFAELLVISGTVLTAVSDDRYGSEAAYKYFYISLLASAFFLLSIGTLYALYGTLNMADLSIRILAEPNKALLPFAIGMLMATFLIKGAVFPFHFWQPDFHTVAPTPVSAILSSVIVKFGVYGLFRMITLLFIVQAASIQLILIILGTVGVFYGGFGAVGTQNAKRMLAYSTLAQVGFILVALGWGNALGLAAAIVFSFNHSLIKAAMLMLAGSLASRAQVKSAAFSILKGIGKGYPIIGILFFIGSLALAGIPPTNGFISKLLVFRTGVFGGQYLILAVIGVGSILTLVYTVRAFQRIWWLQPENMQAQDTIANKPVDQILAPAILIILTVFFGIYAEPIVNVANAASLWLLDHSIYINAVLGGY